MWALVSRYEWAVIEGLVVALLVAELITINRSVRRDREAKAAEPVDLSP